MKNENIEGQLDFLGLINEYRDDQGAMVRVREPGKKKIKPAAPKEELKQLEIVFEEPPEKPKEEPKEKPKKEPKPLEEEKPINESKEILFKQCKKCWCYDCRHNSRNEAVPRDMCGIMMPCPSCDGCIAEDIATICEIGNAKEGCRLRALEEGIIEEEIE